MVNDTIHNNSPQYYHHIIITTLFSAKGLKKFDIILTTRKKKKLSTLHNPNAVDYCAKSNERNGCNNVSIDGVEISVAYIGK